MESILYTLNHFFTMTIIIVRFPKKYPQFLLDFPRFCLKKLFCSLVLLTHLVRNYSSNSRGNPTTLTSERRVQSQSQRIYFTKLSVSVLCLIYKWTRVQRISTKEVSGQSVQMDVRSSIFTEKWFMTQRIKIRKGN